MIAAPKKYANLFRSRLEARWAAFFDMCGWKWEYESVDYDGWIPTFLLIGKRENIPVEVKPIEWFGEYDDIVNCADERTDLVKCKGYIRNNDGKRVLVLGAYPPNYISKVHNGKAICIGTTLFLGYTIDDKPEPSFDAAMLCECGDIDILDEYMNYECFFGKLHWKSLSDIRDDFVETKWREAGRLTQWMAPA